MPTLRLAALALAFASFATSAPPVLAQTIPLDSPRTRSVYLQAGAARQDSVAWTVGLTLPWAHWRKAWWGGELRGHWDVYASQWRADGPTGRVNTTVLGISPALQWHFDQGRSPWFVEGGLGINYGKPRYITLYKEFSTRLNFSSHAALGYRHGAHGQHEWQLRIQHSSNSSIKKPNPGQNFVQLRYALHF